MHGSQTLPKTERLQRGYQFRHAYEQGRKFTGRLVVLYVVENSSARRALGVVTSRKVGGAVVRNRARRLLREAYRLNKQKLKTNLQIVMIARNAINGKRLRDVEAEVLRLFHAASMHVTLRQYPCNDELTTQMLHDMDVWIMERINGVSETSNSDVHAFPGDAS